MLSGLTEVGRNPPNLGERLPRDELQLPGSGCGDSAMETPPPAPFAKVAVAGFANKIKLVERNFRANSTFRARDPRTKYVAGFNYTAK